MVLSVEVVVPVLRVEVPWVEDGGDDVDLREDVVEDPSVEVDEGVVRVFDDVVVDPGSVFCVDVLVTEEDEGDNEDVDLCDELMEDPVLIVCVEVSVTVEVDEDSS